MIWLRTWQLGVKSLLLHPMRSLLTVLGIFIGVASVIWLLAIGEGISREAQKQIEGLGAENIIVRSVKPPSEATAAMPRPGRLRPARGTSTRSLSRRFPRSCRHSRFARCGGRSATATKSVDGRLVGCTPEYAEFTKLEVDRGRFLEDTDVKHGNNNCVLAARLAQELFPYEDPIGKSVYLIEHKDFYTVVGVLKHRNATAAIGGSLAAQEFSSDCYIPISTIRQRVGDYGRHPPQRLVRGRGRRAEPGHAARQRRRQGARYGQAGARKHWPAREDESTTAEAFAHARRANDG